MKFDIKNAICGFCLSLGVVLFAAVIFCVVHGHLVAAAILAFCICILAAVIAGIAKDDSLRSIEFDLLDMRLGTQEKIVEHLINDVLDLRNKQRGVGKSDENA
jgi:hypothetical protein